MLDFVEIEAVPKTSKMTVVKPWFKVGNVKDLMIRGKDFYAVWDEHSQMWRTDEQYVIDEVDKAIDRYCNEHEDVLGNVIVTKAYMRKSDTGSIDDWHKYCKQQMSDNYKPLNQRVLFSNDEAQREDYASFKLTFPLEEGSIKNYDKLISRLYEPKERHKIEWFIGSIVSGASKKLQKFLVLQGAPGTGKSTIINILNDMFRGYSTVFEASRLANKNDSFALEPFKSAPLLAYQHDGDLSNVTDNTRLNSVVSHEPMVINEKFKSAYEIQVPAVLIMATNNDIKITNLNSGLTRRLIDAYPTGQKWDIATYERLMDNVKFELGAIASHCKQVYTNNPHAYDAYISTKSMSATNDMYFFIDTFYSKFVDGISLKQAWELYKQYVDAANVKYPKSMQDFKQDLLEYYEQFLERYTLEDGERVRQYFLGFKKDKFLKEDTEEEVQQVMEHPKIEFKEQPSIFDKEYAHCTAQYANEMGTPKAKWADVKSTLDEIDTSKLHFVKVPENHIVIDFDIKDESGEKSYEKNLEAASKWPDTYAELSKSGAGIHLHYIYNGDVSQLSRIYEDDIEIKVFTGNSSLRRMLTKCNDHDVVAISSGLPLKEKKGANDVVNFESLKNEKALRTLIKRNLNKEYHSSTRCSIDFIYKALEDAYNQGMNYDVSDLQNAIITFAANSTHQSDYCIKKVKEMKFKSEESSAWVDTDYERIAFYDVEVFPNLFIINWKFEGPELPVTRMINPTANDVEKLLKYRLIGFNCRRYDNHILYARLLGYTNEQLYELSAKIVDADKQTAQKYLFGEAYNISYTDIYDFASTKCSLKKWEIELGIHHQELGLPWDQPVPEKLWDLVAEYCDNDVIATEAVWNHLQPDFLARQILADVAGMTVNDTTNSLTTRIIFGKEKHPELVYTNLEETFPGYEFKDGKNMYRDTDLGFGGYVYAEPGIYHDVALLDVASLHPHSIKAMNCFGEYTKNFTDIMDTRIFIKHKEYDKAKQLFGGKLAKYLDDPSTAKQLSQALKIAINSVYGLTSASYDNPFKDPRNVNNIVALRGALFMRTLQDEVKARGFTVAHIKTDSIKIPNATQEIIDFCMDFGRQYGYEFEHEATYEKMCLVNNAVYIAKYAMGEHPGEWTATGAQFQIPYVFKSLFSREPITFDDVTVTNSVKTSIYLDYNENMEDTSAMEKELLKLRKADENPERRQELTDLIEKQHKRVFVGKIGRFCPIKPGCGGAELVRSGVDPYGYIKYSSVTGTKGFRWLEAEELRENGSIHDVDKSYFDKLVDEAVKAISEYGDVGKFISDEPFKPIDTPPWLVACGKETCEGCPYFYADEYHMQCEKNYDISDIIYLNAKESR